MRLAKLIQTVSALLALLAWVALPLPAQTKPPSKPAEAKSSQTGKPPSKAPGVSQPAAKAKAPVKAAPRAAESAKKPAKTAPRKKSAEPAAKVRPASAAQPGPVARRDPFEPLVGRPSQGGGTAERLPPGKAGLVVATLRLDGIVRGPNGMIAVVSNPQQRVYFLREGDQLYDGRVLRISMEGVSFHEVGKDAFGKPIERQVNKRLYPGSGEQR